MATTKILGILPISWEIFEHGYRFDQRRQIFVVWVRNLGPRPPGIKTFTKSNLCDGLVNESIARLKNTLQTG